MYSYVRKIALSMVVVGVGAFGLAEGGSAAQAASSAQTQPVPIMPLGASLTWGKGSSTGNGYRADLQRELVAAGVNLDYVGSVRSGTMADPDNEGHNGYRIDQVATGAAGATGWLNTYSPNVVLLAAGANDVLQDYKLADAPQRLGALIDEIRQERPGVTLMVATLQPLKNTTDNAQVKTFNAAVRTLVQQKVAAGAEGLHLVDLNKVLSVSDLGPDGIHPTDEGYTKIADAWFAGLKPLLAGSTAR